MTVTARLTHSRFQGRFSKGDILFAGFFVLYTATVVLWLVSGLFPVLSASFPSVHETFREWGAGHNWLGTLARHVTAASANAPHGSGVEFDYFFSVVGVSLALLLIWLRPRDLAARLLTVGMNRGGSSVQPTQSQHLRRAANMG